MKLRFWPILLIIFLACEEVNEQPSANASNEITGQIKEGVSLYDTEALLLQNMGVPDVVKKYGTGNQYAYQYGDTLSFVISQPNGISGKISSIDISNSYSGLVTGQVKMGETADDVHSVLGNPDTTVEEVSADQQVLTETYYLEEYILQIEYQNQNIDQITLTASL